MRVYEVMTKAVSTVKPAVLASEAKNRMRQEHIHHPVVTEGSEPKGVGEPAIIPTGAAVANAVSAAIGARLRAMPMTAERCWSQIQPGDRNEQA